MVRVPASFGLVERALLLALACAPGWRRVVLVVLQVLVGEARLDRALTRIEAAHGVRARAPRNAAAALRLAARFARGLFQRRRPKAAAAPAPSPAAGAEPSRPTGHPRTADILAAGVGPP